MRAPRPHQAGDREAGFTLPEVAMSTLLFGILSGIVFTALMTFTDVSTSSIARAANASEAQTAMDRITAESRAAVQVGQPGTSASAVAYASGTEFKFYAQLDPVESGIGPRLVDISLNTATGTLTEADTTAVLNAGVWTYSATPTTTVTLATHVATSRYTGGSTLFTYFPAGIDPTTTPGAALATPMTQGNAAADPGAIDSVQIALWVNQTIGGKPGVDPNLSTETVTVLHLQNVDIAKVPF